MALNRVTGGLGPSEFLGSLTANGRIFLIKRDGILFGSGAVVNTAGFLATTHDIKNSEFMAGRYNFNIPAGRIPRSSIRAASPRPPAASPRWSRRSATAFRTSTRKARSLGHGSFRHNLGHGACERNIRCLPRLVFRISCNGAIGVAKDAASACSFPARRSTDRLNLT